MGRQLVNFRVLTLLAALLWFNSPAIAQTDSTVSDSTEAVPTELVDSSANEAAAAQAEADEAAAAQAAAAQAEADEAAAAQAAAAQAEADEAAAQAAAAQAEADEAAAAQAAAAQAEADEAAAAEAAAAQAEADEAAAAEAAAAQAEADEAAAAQAAAAQAEADDEAAAAQAAAAQAEADEAAAAQAAAAQAEADEAAAAQAAAVQAEADEAAAAQVEADEAAAAEATTAEAEADEAAATTDAEVSEASVKEATDDGEDVVVKKRTSSRDLKEIDDSKEAGQAAVININMQQPVTTHTEVITNQSTRSSNEEVRESTVSRDKDKDDKSQVWKYLGAAAVGVAVGALIPQLGGRVVQNQGDRMIVEREGEFYVRKDENLLLRRPGVTEETESFADGITRSTVTRRNGSQIVTVRDSGGFVLKRTRFLPDGTATVLIDETREIYDRRPSSVNYDQTLPPLRHSLPTERYIVDYSRASNENVRATLLAPPVQPLEQVYTLREVRENHSVREFMPRIDLDSVHFATGSSAIQSSQADALDMIGHSMADIIQHSPSEVFLIEGHTDAVGSNVMNLALSDRRAEAVALALTEYFDIPPENLIVQGYGERYLKVNTQAANQENRRASVRRITPLMNAAG
jgi:outer membrane protein OmpA-like peptidoglycan-associated protein